MRYQRLSIVLFLLLAAFPSPGAAAEPPPTEQQPPRSWRDPFPYVEDVVQAAIRKVQGVQQLEAIERRLESKHPGAVAALREGLDETLTLVTLGVKGALHRTLCSTNPIENLQGAIKRVTKRVKRWRGGSMALRWTATALMDAETRFRRIRGFRELAAFNASLLSSVADPIRRSA